jgi:hypothetical protein
LPVRRLHLLPLLVQQLQRRRHLQLVLQRQPERLLQLLLRLSQALP